MQETCLKYPRELKCEYRENVLGLDITTPGFSWEIGTEHRNQVQTAYQIMVASSEGTLARDDGNQWDSGKIIPNRMINI